MPRRRGMHTYSKGRNNIAVRGDEHHENNNDLVRKSVERNEGKGSFFCVQYWSNERG